MAVTSKARPWDFLQAYRGTEFSGEWPTIPQVFDITCKRFPQNRCFTAFAPIELSLTYEQARKKILEVAGYLQSKAIGFGSKVAVTGKNSPEWAIAYLAILYTGATVVPLDYQLKDEEIDYLLSFAGVEYLFVDAERIDAVGKTGKVQLKELISLEAGHPSYIMDKASPFDSSSKKATESDLAAILFTSGTTGKAKGVMLTHSNLISDCFLAQDLLTVLPTDVFYALLPIHHSYTMLAVFIEAISVGAEIVFGKKLIVTQILKELKKGKVTMFLAVPMLFNKMLKGLMNGIREKGVLVYGLIRFLMMISGVIKKITKKNVGHKMFNGLLAKLYLDKIRIAICGGGPLPSSTFKMFNELGIDLVQGYGLTETSPIITLNPIEAYIERSVGKVLPRTEMKILDPDDRGIGEIAVKGPMVMQGYYKNPDATAEIFDEDGWLKTGDVGYLDANNYLYLTGRKKSLIVTEGGKNVFPEEIEDEFQLFDEIDQICILGYVLDAKMKTEGIRALIHPSEKYVETMSASFADGKRRNEEMLKHMQEIVDKVNKDLLPYKRISRVDLVDEPFEMSSTKKIKRFIYAEKYKYL